MSTPPSGRSIRVLFVEDTSEDVELALRSLASQGFAVVHRVVETEEGLLDALAEPPWDVIIADYAMPQFNGLRALRMVQEAGLDVPFLLVSGTVGEEVAVEAMRAGAQDYVLKERLTRLPLVVVRELREAHGRREQRRIERLQRFVTSVSAALVESIDYETTLRRVAELIAGEVAEACLVEVVDRSGSPGRTVIALRDPSRAALAQALEQECASPEPPSRAELLEKLGARSFLTVPLEARGQALGALTLIAVDPNHVYGEPEAELARELSRRVAAAVDNARLYREAQEAVALRDEFIAVASHELKTPTFAVQLQLEGLHALSTALGDSVDPRLEPRLGRASAMMGRVSRLVESLLDVSRLSVGKLELEKSNVDLVPIVRQLVDNIRGHGEAVANISVLGEPSLEGRWDRLRIEQVIDNLLGNAMKYGAGRPIEISVGRRDASAVLVVTDHGMGVSPGDFERIFGRFERGVSLKHYGGLGVGLYVAKQITEAHGGTLLVKETPGGGATFVVELPLN
jgi:signal transduction histidine kinase